MPRFANGSRFFCYHIYFIFVVVQYEIKNMAMKKTVIILAVVFAAGILSSSCTKHACPAYSQVDTEQTEHAG